MLTPSVLWTLILPAAAALFVLSIALRSYLSERASLVAQHRAVALSDLGDLGELAGLRDVACPTAAGIEVRGWLLASRRGATVLLAHGSGATRLQVVPQARLLAHRGFGVLLFDWPGHGASGGEASWGGEPLGALRACLDFLGHETSDRIGAYGFSMGGYFLARFAPDDTRVAALAVEGAPGSALQQTRYEYRRYGPVSQLPALFALRQAGWSAGERCPLDTLPALAPRALFVIAGGEDRAVPPFMARQLVAAARGPAEIWEVPGAGHGECLDTAPVAYADRLAGFFERALARR